MNLVSRKNVFSVFEKQEKINLYPYLLLCQNY